MTDALDEQIKDGLRELARTGDPVVALHTPSDAELIDASVDFDELLMLLSEPQPVGDREASRYQLNHRAAAALLEYRNALLVSERHIDAHADLVAALRGMLAQYGSTDALSEQARTALSRAGA